MALDKLLRCSIGVPILLAGLAVSSPLSATPAHAATPAPSRWHAPLPGPLTVTRPFTPPSTRYGTGHRGVDVTASPGTPVLAAGAGVVGYAGLLAGRGVVTVLHDGGLRTTYEPVAATVRVGQRVVAGEQLGLLQPGHPGCPASACLHWALLRGADYLDPLRLLGGGPVRLLPLWDADDAAPGDAAPAGAAPHPQNAAPAQTAASAATSTTTSTATPVPAARSAPVAAPVAAPAAPSGQPWHAARLLGAGAGTGGLLLTAGLVAGRRRHRRRPAGPELTTGAVVDLDLERDRRRAASR